MKTKNFTPTKYSFLCSGHFVPNNYQIRHGANVILLNDNAYLRVVNAFSKYL